MIQHTYADDNIRFDLADVQHIEHAKVGLTIVFKSTRWNFEKDLWDNPAFIPERNEQRFLTVWHHYKSAMHKLNEATQ